jgi:hypothetical protein
MALLTGVVSLSTLSPHSCRRSAASLPCLAATRTLRIGRLGFGSRGDRKWLLNDGQLPNFRVVRVQYVSSGYSPGEGNRRAWRNSRVSSSTTRIPLGPIRKLHIARLTSSMKRNSTRGAVRGCEGAGATRARYCDHTRVCCVMGRLHSARSVGVRVLAQPERGTATTRACAA